MAIPYFQINAQSRSKGASAIAKATYNAGDKLHDQHGQLFAYDRKSGIKHCVLVFSPTAQNPGESRESFWQAVEQSEKRKDACLSREFQGALPCELTYEQNLKLAQEFTETIIARYNLRAADLSIHYPTKRKPRADQTHDNPHLHLLIPDRNAKGKKLGMNHNRNEIFDLRNLWEKTVNAHLAAAGQATRISLKSHTEQIKDLNTEIAELEQHKRDIIRQLEEIEQEQQNADRTDTRATESSVSQSAPTKTPASRETDHRPGIGVNVDYGSPRRTECATGSGIRANNNADTGSDPRLTRTNNSHQESAKNYTRQTIDTIATGAKITSRINALRYERQKQYKLNIHSQSQELLTKQIINRIKGLRYERHQQYKQSSNQNQEINYVPYKP